MLVMVATNETQGALPGDYAHTVEGELVTPGVTQCDNPECGCDRGFAGLASSRGTTTAIVADRPWISPRDLADAVTDWLERDGWRGLIEHANVHRLEDGLDPDDPDEILAGLVDEHVFEIVRLCQFFGAGAVLCRHDEEVIERIIRRAA